MYGLSKSGLSKKKPPHGQQLPSPIKGKNHDIVGSKHHDISKHVSNRIHYFEQLQKEIDAHSTKAESISLRKNWLDKQKKINYTNEYDRLRSTIAQNQMTGRHGVSEPHLKQKMQNLINLGAQSLNGIH